MIDLAKIESMRLPAQDDYSRGWNDAVDKVLAILRETDDPNLPSAVPGAGGGEHD